MWVAALRNSTQIKKEKTMAIILSGLVLILLVLIILAGTIRSKFKDIYNPIKKDNSDYRFIEVENIKTRSIFRG